MNLNSYFSDKISGRKCYFGSIIILLIILFFHFNLQAQAEPDDAIPNWLYDEHGDGGGDYGDEFGRAVAVDGEWLIVGARRNSSSGERYEGRVFFWRFVFDSELNKNVWKYHSSTKSDESDWEEFFGQSVALDGNRAIIGAHEDDNNGQNGAGAAFIFEYNAGKDLWEQKAKLDAGIWAGAHDRFGISVDLDGNWAVVGAYFDDDNGTSSGSGYIFYYNGSTWNLYQKLWPNDPAGGDHFGWDVAISGPTIVVGAQNKNNNEGAAYIFDNSSGSWAQKSKLMRPGGGANYYFGQGVDIDGDVVIVGADAGYIFRKPAGGWPATYTEAAKLTTPHADKNDRLGWDVAINGDIAAVSATYLDAPSNNEGGVFVYTKSPEAVWTNMTAETGWLEASNPTEIAHLGFDIDLDNNTILVGADRGTGVEPNTGSAYVVTLTPNLVTNFQASNECSYPNSPTDIYLTWELDNDNSSYFKVDEFKIFRDNNTPEIYTHKSPENLKYTDENLNPGSVHTYRIYAKNKYGVSASIYTVGRTYPNGEISGKIYAGSANVPDIFTYINQPLGNALQFNGSSDYAIIEHSESLNPVNQITVEAWVKSDEFDRSEWQQIIGKGGDAPYTTELRQFGLRPVISIGRPYFYIHDSNNQAHGVEASIPLTNGIWHHLAASYDGQYLKIYINGELRGVKDIGSYTIQTSKAPLVIGRLLNGTLPQDYHGLIDEVRLWNIARSESEIHTNMNRLLNGTEEGLIGYWRMDAGTGLGIYDYKFYLPPIDKKNGYLSDVSLWSGQSAPILQGDISSLKGDYTNYTIDNISYEINGTEFSVTPDTTGGHIFDPKSETVELTKDFYIEEPINFKDLSQFSVDGRIIFENTDYGIDGVNLIDEYDNLLYTTEMTGTFNIALQAGEHRIIPSLYNHCFVPADTNISVTQNITGLVFKDTTHYILRGKFAAGKDCFDIGEASLIINWPNNCFEKKVTTVSGDYEISLPALPNISVSIDSINGEPLSEFLLDHSGDIKVDKTVSLVEGDATLDFIYYAKPKIVVQGLPDPETVYNVPVLEFMDYEAIKIKITEDYGNDRISFADSGTIHIINNISDENNNSNIEIDGSEEYPLLFRIGVPNIIPGSSHPYQKRFYARVKTGGGEVDTSIWVIVTGYRPREQTFATVSPAIPLLILHDPPGDHSYSYMEESESISFTTSWSMLDDKSQNDYKTLKVGNAFSAQAGFVTLETAVWLMKDKQVNVGSSALNQNEQQFTITTLERYQTSAAETDIGADGDVFIGAAFNIIYALADILEINDIGEVELSISIIYGLDNEDAFETTYIYTKKHIEDILLPRFKENLSAETDFDRIQYWKDQIEIWQQIIAYNDSLKLIANEPFGGQTSISISGGTERYYSTTLEQTMSHTIEFNSYIDTDVAREAGLEIAGSGYKQGVQVRTRFNTGKSEKADTTVKQTMGYCIYDDESVDNFWIEIKGDPVYGTPVFDLQEGSYTSWPWEKGTVPHEKCLLDIAGDYVLSDIEPDADAVFTLELTNISPSGWASSYKLFDIPTSNPDGAEMSLYGFSINDVSPFQLEAYQTASVPLVIKRGPYAYDYDDLQLKLRSLNDEQIADTVTFSVHYTAPCSPIHINEPQDNWIVSKNNHDSLKIVLTDYDKTKMTTVMIQYRPKNKTTWENASQFQAGSFPDNNAVIYWNTKGLPEGTYDLRTRVNWNQATGYTYSNKVNGLIDRLPPEIFGKPQPADGVLRSGGQISITFNEDIDKNTAKVENVTMTNVQNGNIVPVSVTSNERTMIITPQVEDKVIENHTFQISLLGIGDVNGNVLNEAIVWSFYVNTNPVYWTPVHISKTSLEGETTTFWSKIKNESGSNVNFNLKNRPAWLNADPASGSIIKGSECIINFEVNPGLIVGHYIDTLHAETPKGDEPLFLDLHIQYRPPEWTINPAAFTNSMSIIAGFYIGEVPFSKENDLVAAFMGDSLRGMVKVQRVVPQDEYVAFLTIYSNENNNERLDFRIWDASEGTEFEITESYAFIADTSYGSAVLPESLHVADAKLQSVALSKNWSWFSLGVEAKDMSTVSILEKLRARDGDLIKSQTEYCQYLPGTGWVGTLDTLDIGASFKICLTESRTLDFIGTPVSIIDRPIAVESGWNWIGYLPANMMGINDALASLDATVTEGDQIMNQHTYATYTQSRWQGLLESMIPDEGYMLKSTNSSTLTYPGSAGKMIFLPSIMMARAGQNSAPAWQVDAADFEYSMNVTSKLTIDGLPVVSPFSILAAFINNDCRGISKPVFVKDKWLFFLTVYSNNVSDDSVQFKIFDADNDQVRDIDLKFEYIADKVRGTPAAPLILWVGIPTGLEDESELPREFALEQNYPNPFNPVTTIRYALKQPEEVKLILYNMLGQKIKILVDEPQKAGWYDIRFNAKDLASGVYIYRIKAGKFMKSHKMIIIK